MRWQFIDRITQFEPWTFIRGQKKVSLEEYLLLRPFGRAGQFPESLILESTVHLSRWLVLKSSDFQKACILIEVDNFKFTNQVEAGSVLEIAVKSLTIQDDFIQIESLTYNNEREISRGLLTLKLMGLDSVFYSEDVETNFGELTKCLRHIK